MNLGAMYIQSPVAVAGEQTSVGSYLQFISNGELWDSRETFAVAEVFFEDR